MNDKKAQLARLIKRKNVLYKQVLEDVELAALMDEREKYTTPDRLSMLLTMLHRLIDLEESGCFPWEADLIIEEEAGLTFNEMQYGTVQDKENKKKLDEIQEAIISIPYVAEFLELPKIINDIRHEINGTVRRSLSEYKTISPD